jgi:serine/threonine protein kinase
MKFSKKESTYFLRQASIFMGLKNIELVATKLYKMFMSRNQFFFVYEQPTETHMTLTEYLLSLKDPLSTTLIKKFAQYLLKCLQMCHNKEIAHLDLQPDHILIFQTKEDMNESIHSAHADYSSPQNFNEEIIRLHDDSSEFIRLSNFFMSGGLDHKKFSHNKMSSLHFMAPERILGTVDLKD